MEDRGIGEEGSELQCEIKKNYYRDMDKML